MQANQTLELEAEPPADRAAKRAALRIIKRDINRRVRAKARATGIVPVTVEIPQTMVADLDEIKRRAGLRNRSQAFAHIMALLGAHPQLKQELGL